MSLPEQVPDYPQADSEAAAPLASPAYSTPPPEGVPSEYDENPSAAE